MKRKAARSPANAPDLIDSRNENNGNRDRPRDMHLVLAAEQQALKPSVSRKQIGLVNMTPHIVGTSLLQPRGPPVYSVKQVSTLVGHPDSDYVIAEHMEEKNPNDLSYHSIGTLENSHDKSFRQGPRAHISHKVPSPYQQDGRNDQVNSTLSNDQKAVNVALPSPDLSPQPFKNGDQSSEHLSPTLTSNAKKLAAVDRRRNQGVNA